MEKPDRPRRQVTAAELIIPVAGTLYAIYYVVSVWDFPPEAQRSGMFLAGGLLFLTTIYFIRTAMQAFQGNFSLSVETVLGPPEGRLNRLAFVGLIFGYLAIVRWGGFTLTTFLFLLFGSRLGGVPTWRQGFIFAAVSAIAGWLFFIVLLGTRFPTGPFENAVSWMVRLWN